MKDFDSWATMSPVGSRMLCLNHICYLLLLYHILSVYYQQVELESLKGEYANAQLECSAADERAKLLASEVIGLEEKVYI